jgi:hypothetical protein
MKIFKSFSKFIKGLLTDESGNPSSKRFVGIVSGLSLCGALFINLFTEHPVDPYLVNSVAALAFGTLGLSSVDKIWAKRDPQIDSKNEEKKENIEQINS